MVQWLSEAQVRDLVRELDPLINIQEESHASTELVHPMYLRKKKNIQVWLQLAWIHLQLA